MELLCLLVYDERKSSRKCRAVEIKYSVDSIDAEGINMEFGHPIDGIFQENRRTSSLYGPSKFTAGPPLSLVRVREIRPVNPRGNCLQALDGCRRHPGLLRFPAHGRHSRVASALPVRRTNLAPHRDTRVVTPVSVAGKLRHRHDLESSDSKVFEISRVRDNGLESSDPGESTDVNFVKDVFGEGKPCPAVILPRRTGNRPTVRDRGRPGAGTLMPGRGALFHRRSRLKV